MCVACGAGTTSSVYLAGVVTDLTVLLCSQDEYWQHELPSFDWRSVSLSVLYCASSRRLFAFVYLPFQYPLCTGSW